MSLRMIALVDVSMLEIEWSTLCSGYLHSTQNEPVKTAKTQESVCIESHVLTIICDIAKHTIIDIVLIVHHVKNKKKIRENAK